MLRQSYQRLLASAPSRRLNPAKLAEAPALKNSLVDTIAFLESLAVKDSAEKDLFFKRLPAALPALPAPVAQRKLLPMLANALEFGGAPAVALGALLQVRRPRSRVFARVCVSACWHAWRSTSCYPMRWSLAARPPSRWARCCR